MNLNQLTEQQRSAILDLAVLAMYVDGHLAAAEDARVQRMLTKMGFEEEYDRNREFDAAVTRIRPRAESVESARAHGKTLMAAFSSPEQERAAIQIVGELVLADRAVSERESGFLAMLRDV